VLNISKTNHSLNLKPHLNLLLNNVAIEKVEEAKLLGVTLDRKLSCQNRYSMVTKMGRSLSMIRRCSAFLISQWTRQVLQTLVLSHLDYCPVVWSGAAKKVIGQLQFVQNRAARIALRCTRRVNVSNMHFHLSWLKVLKVPNCLFKQLAHSSDTHRNNTRHAIWGLYTVPRSRAKSGKRTVLNRATLPALVTQNSNKTR
jgi:hypothetical protein